MRLSHHSPLRKLLFVALVLSFSAKALAQTHAKEAANTNPAVVHQVQKRHVKPTPMKIMAVGDIMMGTNFPNDSYLPPPGKGPFDAVNKVLSEADILFGNLEGTLTNTGENAKRCADPSKCYSFRSPESYGAYLKAAGFDVMSIANNHIGDFGAIGIKNTSKVLEKHGIAYAGTVKQPAAIFEKDGVTYGFCAFAPNKGCVNINDLAYAKKIVSALNERAAIVLVSFHGGAEGAEHTHVPRKTERFYGEDRGDVYRFAHAMIDAGADVVIGHGPHVPRAFEVYNNKFIAYSLGNFCTYARFNLNGIKGYAPIAEIAVDPEGNFIKGKLHAAKQINRGYPFIDSEKGVLKAIEQLTREDFPESQLVFEEDGSFTSQKQ